MDFRIIIEVSEVKLLFNRGQLFSQKILLLRCSKSIEAIVDSVPIHMLAYYAAVELENVVDQSRNLAKSVTVE